MLEWCWNPSFQHLVPLPLSCGLGDSSSAWKLERTYKRSWGGKTCKKFLEMMMLHEVGLEECGWEECWLDEKNLQNLDALMAQCTHLLVDQIHHAWGLDVWRPLVTFLYPINNYWAYCSYLKKMFYWSFKAVFVKIDRRVLWIRIWKKNKKLQKYSGHSNANQWRKYDHDNQYERVTNFHALHQQW